MKRLAVTVLVLAMSGMLTCLQATELTEAAVKAHRWGPDALVASHPNGNTLFLLTANGPFEACSISTEGGGAAIARGSSKVAYGCWQAIQKEADGTMWISIRMNDGAEALVPFSDFRKRPYDPAMVGPPDLWTDENYRKVGRRIADHIDQANRRVKMLTTLTPSFDAAQKTAAAACLARHETALRQYLSAVELIHAEHQAIINKWPAPGELDESTLEARRREIGMVVEMAEKLALRTFPLDSNLRQCLQNKNVPFQ